MGIFALASCEDVPAPYVVPGSGNGSNGTPNADYIINQTFSSSLGTFQSESESGQIAWKGDSRYGAVVSGYDDWDGSGTKTNQAGVTYLVSPEIDLTDVDSAYVTIEQAINYAKNTLAEDNKLMIRVGNGEWVELPMNYNGLGSSGKKVQLGLKHTAHDTYSSTWEVKSLSVSKGQIPADSGEGGETPAGTEVTCAQAVELTNALEDGATSAEVYSVTGYITEVVGNVSKNQQTFWMADTKDGGKVFEAFYANLPEGVTEFKAGMKVKITGNLMKFVKNEQVTPEIKNATVEILENGGDTPTPTIEGGTIEDPYTVEEALQIINDGTYTSAKVYVTGKISEIKEINTEYGNATYYISDDGTTTTQLQVFRGTSLGGEKFQETDELAVGDKVTVYGTLTMYQNTTPEITGSQLFELNGEIAGGGNGGNGGNDGDATSITFSDKGYTNAQDFEGKDITVGEAKLTWSKGTGSTTPKYYDTGAAMRLYGGNTLTISSSKSISKVVFTYNGADYTPTSESATATPGSYDFSTHTWTGNATSVVLKNTASKGHFRIVSVSITYAE